jgi:glycosyltransferase involved in cell wall biosynthesis
MTDSEQQTIHLEIDSIINIPKQTICLAMIVKNEIKVLERCFNSVKRLVDYWVICDTGSTDGTQELIKSYWEKEGVKGELYEHEWKNFGHNRSLLMKHAKGKADYIITLDADEVFEFDDDFVMPYLDKDLYNIWSRKSTTDYQRTQLVSDKFEWYYKGVCHEYITFIDKEGNRPTTQGVLEKIRNIPYPDGFRSADPNKYKRDALLFEQALLDEPNNSRYIYYLAQSYRDCKEYDNAIKYYIKRVEMEPNGNSEEKYYAQYQIAICKISKEEPFENYMFDLLKAYNIRPSRLEAAHTFVKICRMKNLHYLGYQTFKHVLERPTLHTNDSSFLTIDVYNWSMKNELALLAFSSKFYGDAIKILENVYHENKYPSSMKETIEHNIKAMKHLVEEIKKQSVPK